MNLVIRTLVLIYLGFIRLRISILDDHSYGNGKYQNTIYPGLQISNAGESIWNESNLWPEWGIYAENTRYHIMKWSNNLTTTELGNFYPPWIIMGWIETASEYEKDYYIRLKNTTASQTYSLTVNATILVGCTWRANRENIQVFHSGEGVLANNISWTEESNANWSGWDVIQESTDTTFYDCSLSAATYGIFERTVSYDIENLEITDGTDKITVKWRLARMGQNGIFGWYDHTISYWPSEDTMLRGLYSQWNDDLSDTLWQGESDSIITDYYHGWFYSESDILKRTFWLNTFYSRYLTVSFQIYVGCVTSSTLHPDDTIQVKLNGSPSTVQYDPKQLHAHVHLQSFFAFFLGCFLESLFVGVKTK